MQTTPHNLQFWRYSMQFPPTDVKFKEGNNQCYSVHCQGSGSFIPVLLLKNNLQPKVTGSLSKVQFVVCRFWRAVRHSWSFPHRVSDASAVGKSGSTREQRGTLREIWQSTNSPVEQIGTDSAGAIMFGINFLLGDMSRVPLFEERTWLIKE